VDIEFVSLQEVIAAAQAKHASLVPESSGYLILALGDAIDGVPLDIDPERCMLNSEGTVSLAGTNPPVAMDRASQNVRRLFRRLLEASHGTMPALNAAARAPADGLATLERFFTAVTKALIPINRSAAKRALARLARETQRAKANGVELGGNAPTGVSDQVAPQELDKPLTPERDSSSPSNRRSASPTPTLVDACINAEHEVMVSALATALPGAAPDVDQIEAQRRAREYARSEESRALDLELQRALTAKNLAVDACAAREAVAPTPVPAQPPTTKATKRRIAVPPALPTTTPQRIQLTANDPAADNHAATPAILGPAQERDEETLDELARLLREPDPEELDHSDETEGPLGAVAESSESKWWWHEGSGSWRCQWCDQRREGQPSAEPCPNHPGSACRPDPTRRAEAPAAGDAPVAARCSDHSISIESLVDHFGRINDGSSLEDAARSLKGLTNIDHTPTPASLSVSVEGQDDTHADEPASPSPSPVACDASDNDSLPPAITTVRRRRVRSSLLLGVALFGGALNVLGLVWIARPLLTESSSGVDDQAASSNAAAAPDDACRAKLTLTDLPSPHEVLSLLGSAPLESPELPTGVPLELVATAPGHLAKRIVVASDSSWKMLDHKRILELNIRLEQGRSERWPEATAGDFGGVGPVGHLQVTDATAGTQLWLVVGIGEAETHTVDLPCNQDATLLVVNPAQPRQRRRMTVETPLLRAAAASGGGELSVLGSRL